MGSRWVIGLGCSKVIAGHAMGEGAAHPESIETRTSKVPDPMHLPRYPPKSIIISGTHPSRHLINRNEWAHFDSLRE